MKKKILLGISAAAAVAAPIATVVACGSTEDISYPTLSKTWVGQSKQETIAKESGSIPTGITKENTHFVSDGGDIRDKSFNQSVLEGMQEARNVRGDNKVFSDNVKSPKKSSEILSSYTVVKGSGGKLIVAAGFNHGTAIKEFAKDNKNIGIVYIDGISKTAGGKLSSNVASVQFDMGAPSFVMGLLAAEEATKLDSKIQW